VGACGTTQNLHKNDPVLQNQLIGGYEYVKKHQSFALKEQPIGSKYKMVLTGKKYDAIWNYAEIYLNGTLNEEYDLLWMATPQGEFILHEKRKRQSQYELAKSIYRIEADGSLVSIGWIDANGKRNINSANSEVRYTRILTAEEQKVLREEQNVLREKVLGTYELKKGEDIIKAVFLENGIVKGFLNGKYQGPDDKWKIVGKEVHDSIENTHTLVWRINNDGSLTAIAEIHNNGKRLPREKAHHLTLRKIKTAAAASLPWVSDPSDPNNVKIEEAIRKDYALRNYTGELTESVLGIVTNLRLSFNQLTDVKGLEKLTQLKTLELYRNKLTNVNGLENLTNLETLNLQDNQLTSVKGLEKLTQLKTLKVSNNQLTDVKGLEKLTQLKTLEVSNNQLTDVKGLEKLTQLENLELYRNKLTNVNGLEKLTQLEKLYLGGNQLTKLPEGMENLTQLKTLWLNDNKLTDVKGLEKLTQLKVLYLGDNQLTDVKGLEKLDQLTRLDLSKNQLTDVKGLENLTQLTSLSIGGNQLTKMPEGLENLTQLKTLRLGNKQLTSVKGLEKLTQLTELYLTYNQLTEVPKELEKLTKLKVLELRNNQLTDMKGLEKLTQLTRLDLIYNKLTSVNDLEKLTQLRRLSLQGNPDLTKAQIDELKKALPKCTIHSNPTK
jgi:Leucine-rich repeat (LRR) protein